jgi:osmoprotectant transport system ATP-binding protein
VDPVVRGQLQEEFLRLQREIGKTIIMVTHDIDEALKLGDQVAVMRVGGKLAQMATPSELLTSPADEFVADFVGRDRGYRSLGFTKAGSVAIGEEAVVQLGASGEEARAKASGAWVLVVDGGRKPLGWAQPELLNGELKRENLNLSGIAAAASGTMRQLLDAALSSPSRRGVVVNEHGELIGTVTATDVVKAIEAEPHLETAR